MKISCYNKGTKEKESNKKCSQFSKKKRKLDQWLDRGRPAEVGGVP